MIIPWVGYHNPCCEDIFLHLTSCLSVWVKTKEVNLWSKFTSNGSTLWSSPSYYEEEDMNDRTLNRLTPCVEGKPSHIYNPEASCELVMKLTKQTKEDTISLSKIQLSKKSWLQILNSYAVEIMWLRNLNPIGLMLATLILSHKKCYVALQQTIMNTFETLSVLFIFFRIFLALLYNQVIDYHRFLRNEMQCFTLYFLPVVPHHTNWNLRT